MKNVLRHIFLMPVYIYRYVVSPFLPNSCRYYPSCSVYAIEAIMLHGIIRGSWLTICRLARCHPWSASGVDPVPPVSATSRKNTF